MPARKPGSVGPFTLRELRQGFTDAGERLRLGRPLKQHELAKRCMVDQATISNIETGKSPGSPDLMHRLALALDVDIKVVIAARDETIRRAQAKLDAPRRARNG